MPVQHFETPEQRIDRLNRAIKMPLRLSCDDGRWVALKVWQPKVEHNGLVSVVIEGTIRIDDLPVYCNREQLSRLVRRLLGGKSR